MGVIVTYACQKCDFVADDVYIGPGWISNNESVLCQDCGTVGSCPIDEKNKTFVEKYAHCRKCGSSNIVLWDHRCPKCGSTLVDEDCVGMWD